MNQLIRCINCDEVFFRTPFDQWPEYKADLPGSPGPFLSVEKNDFQDFMEHHRGHRLEDLSILEDSFVSEKPYIEPVKVSYFRATNGKEKFVIKKFRERIDEPLKYQLIQGDYSLKCQRVEIQGDAIAKQLRMDLRKIPFIEEKTAAFLKVFHQIARGLEIQHLERVAEDSPYPLEIYYRLDDVSLAYLLRNCRNIFKDREYREIETFINGHKDDGVLLLRAKYAIQLSERAKAREKSTTGSVALNKAMEKKQEMG